MFYDPVSEKVYDYVDGKADIGRKVLRTIGDADKRFAEDYLRMLRAVRFSVQLGFEIEAKTWQAVCSGAGNISKISGERIAMELEAILSCPGRGRGVELLCESGLGTAIFGGQMCAIGLKVVSNLPVDAGFILSLAGLFSGVECDVAMEKCEILMLSNSQSRVLQFLLDNRGVLLDGSMRLAELKLLLASGNFEELLAFERAIGETSGVSGDGLEVTASRAKELAPADIAPKPLLDGHELMELGVEEGPKLGRASREMYLLQLDGELVDKKGATEWVKDRLSSEE
jgi:tRNA nucleotidyltransferase/poly(A) polymerase